MWERYRAPVLSHGYQVPNRTSKYRYLKCENATGFPSSLLAIRYRTVHLNIGTWSVRTLQDSRPLSWLSGTRHSPHSAQSACSPRSTPSQTGKKTKNGQATVLRIRIRIRIRQLRTYIHGPPGSGSFYHQAKMVWKTFIPTALWLLFDFLSLKNYVNVPSKSNKQNFF